MYVLVLTVYYVNSMFLFQFNVLFIKCTLCTTIIINIYQTNKHHSTETTLLSVHDHIMKAVSHQQLTCLTLVELTAAFESIPFFLNVFHPGLACLLLALGSNLIY